MYFQSFSKTLFGPRKYIFVVGNTERHKTVLSHELENREGHFSHHFRILSRFLHSTTYHPPIVLTLQATFQANIILLSDASPLQNQTIIQRKCISHKRLNAFAREAFQNYFAIVVLKFFKNFTVKRGTQVLIQSKILHTFSYDYVTRFLSDICYFWANKCYLPTHLSERNFSSNHLLWSHKDFPWRM